MKKALAVPGAATEGPRYADAGPSYHACNAANVSTSPVALKIDILEQNGTLLAYSGAMAVQLAAGISFELISGSYTGFARYRFTVFGGSYAIRANMTVFHQTGTFFDLLAFSETR